MVLCCQCLIILGRELLRPLATGGRGRDAQVLHKAAGPLLCMSAQRCEVKLKDPLGAIGLGGTADQGVVQSTAAVGRAEGVLPPGRMHSELQERIPCFGKAQNNLGGRYQTAEINL